MPVEMITTIVTMIITASMKGTNNENNNNTNNNKRNGNELIIRTEGDEMNDQPEQNDTVVEVLTVVVEVETIPGITRGGLAVMKKQSLWQMCRLQE